MKRIAALILAMFILSGCGCTHESWADANCTEPMCCLGCGKTTGVPLGHDWQEADCEHPRTCINCGKTSGEARGHNWREATEEAPKTCKSCGATEGSPIEAEKPDFDELYEEICKWISGKLGGSSTEFAYDSDKMTLLVTANAKKGTVVSLAMEDADIGEYMQKKSELLCSVSNGAAEKFSEAGFDIECYIALMNDIDNEKVILSARNGRIIFDVREQLSNN